MTDSLPSSTDVATREVPVVFEAFEEYAAYVDASLTRAQAITLGRDACWVLRDEFLRRELRAVRVYLRPVDGDEADEFFAGEFESGWIEVPDRPLTEAQRRSLVPMWKVEPRNGG